MEQGGSNSSEYNNFTYTNENRTSAQKSKQGIDLGNWQIISRASRWHGVGSKQTLPSLQYSIPHAELLQEVLRDPVLWQPKLTMIYKVEESRLKAHNPIKIEGHDIKFCSKADHVGVVQSSASNRPHILSRICSHRKALRMKSRANPLVGLWLQCIYGTPVLYYYQGC